MKIYYRCIVSKHCHKKADQFCSVGNINDWNYLFCLSFAASFDDGFKKLSWVKLVFSLTCGGCQDVGLNSVLGYEVSCYAKQMLSDFWLPNMSFILS